MEQRRCDTICELVRAGHGASDIIKLTKYKKSTVYDVVKRFRDSGVSKRKDHSPRSDKVRTPCFLAGLKCSINANPATPMSVHAKKRNVCRASNSPDLNPLDYF